jgi:hypothetical protein
MFFYNVEINREEEDEECFYKSFGGRRYMAVESN